MDLVRGFQAFDDDSSGCMSLREFNSFLFSMGIHNLSVADVQASARALQSDVIRLDNAATWITTSHLNASNARPKRATRSNSLVRAVRL